MSFRFYRRFGSLAVLPSTIKEEKKATVHSAGHSKTAPKNVLSHVKKKKSIAIDTRVLSCM